MIELSKGTHARIRALFPPSQWAAVEELLRYKCGDNLPAVESSWAQLAERIRFAVLRLSEGDLVTLQREIEEAHVDWRDTLMAAGFGQHASAHKRWKPWQAGEHPPRRRQRS